MKYPQLVSMPSAVSDWLEEQLEARGIDAVVYTRYVLSLLHTHTVDAIYADDDQLVPFKKEVANGSGKGNRKRFRRFTNDKWRYADPEQLKRSAAVQCLRSASDHQNCEVESLVDELCAKLKEVNSSDSEALSPKELNHHHHLHKSQKKNQQHQKKKQPTNQELAEKYYAAFPPLCRGSSVGSSPSKLLTKWIQKTSPPKSKKKKPSPQYSNRKFSYDSKFFNKDTPSSSVVVEMKNSRTARRKLNFGGRSKYCNYLIKGDTKLIKSGNSCFKPLVEDQAILSVEKKDLSSRDEDIITMYDDLPVNFRQLLSSPTPTLSYETEMMNLANMRDTGARVFIPCGTNITSSIWSSDAAAEKDNKVNTALDQSKNNEEEDDGSLHMQFKSISINNNNNNNVTKTTDWPSFDVTQQFIEQQNLTNSYFDEINKYKSWSNNANNIIGHDAAEEREKNIQLSCFKLNHNEATSAFKVAKVTTRCHRFNPFQSPIFANNITSNGNGNLRRTAIAPPDGDNNNKEDLLTSYKSHFKPINEEIGHQNKSNNNNNSSNNNGNKNAYVDGATFIINNNLDKVQYKRSDSGFMYLETEFGNKKYSELRLEEIPSSESTSPSLAGEEFTLKFTVRENDKACQTDLALTEQDGADQPADKMDTNCIKENSLAMNKDYDWNRAVLKEQQVVVDDEEMDICWRTSCDNCNKNNNNNMAAMSWNADWLRNVPLDSKWDNQSLRNIWNGGDVCHNCLNLNIGRPPPTDQLLRDDISQDGEQLLSDLSSLQQNYNEETLPTEIKFDLSSVFQPLKERKRRHSFIDNRHDAADDDDGDNDNTNEMNRSSWSFASRLEEDCLIQMSTIPTLRSVTL